MKKLGAFLLWSLVFVAIVLVTDQLLVRIEPKTPALAEVRAFYVDLRARLFGLSLELPSFPDRKSPASAAKPAPAKKAEPRPATPTTEPKAATPPPAPSTTAPKAAAPTPPAKPVPTAKPPAKAAGYVWADAKGELRFADTLDEVPPAFRKQAQPLAQ